MSLPKIYLYRRIVLAKLFIDQHFGEKIDLNDIAGEASFSKFHFIRLFKMAYDKTPHQYLMGVRMENAKLLLKQGLTVSDTCYSVGFEELSSFVHLFKRYTKSTPSGYQQKHHKRQTEMEQAPLKFIPGCFAEKKGWSQNRNNQQTDSADKGDF